MAEEENKGIKNFCIWGFPWVIPYIIYCILYGIQYMKYKKYHDFMGLDFAFLILLIIISPALLGYYITGIISYVLGYYGDISWNRKALVVFLLIFPPLLVYFSDFLNMFIQGSYWPFLTYALSTTYPACVFTSSGISRGISDAIFDGKYDDKILRKEFNKKRGVKKIKRIKREKKFMRFFSKFKIIILTFMGLSIVLLAAWISNLGLLKFISLNSEFLLKIGITFILLTCSLFFLMVTFYKGIFDKHEEIRYRFAQPSNLPKNSEKRIEQILKNYGRAAFLFYGQFIVLVLLSYVWYFPFNTEPFINIIFISLLVTFYVIIWQHLFVNAKKTISREISDAEYRRKQFLKEVQESME